MDARLLAAASCRVRVIVSVKTCCYSVVWCGDSSMIMGKRVSMFFSLLCDRIYFPVQASYKLAEMFFGGFWAWIPF